MKGADAQPRILQWNYRSYAEYYGNTFISTYLGYVQEVVAFQEGG